MAVPRPEVPKAAWDELAARSDEAWYQHLYDFGQTLAAWPGFSDHSFAIVHVDAPARLLAVVPCHVSAGHWITSIYPACPPELGGRQATQVRLFSRSHMVSIACRLGLHAVYSYAPPMAPRFHGPDSPRVNPLLHMRFDNIQTQTFVLDLRPGLDAIWKGLHAYCRTHIRKAEKEGVTVRIADRPADIEAYYSLHTDTYRRNALNPHPFAYFEAIWEYFAKPGFAKIFLAERDGIVIAADNEAVWKGAMGGWTAAGRPEAAAVGANNLLHWHAMKWAVSQGCSWYESGEGFPEAGEGKKKGLTDFKKSFGGELYPFFKGQIVLPSAVPSPDPILAMPRQHASILRRLARRIRGSIFE